MLVILRGSGDRASARELEEALGLRMKRDLGAKHWYFFPLPPPFPLATLLLIKSDLLHLLENKFD